MAGQPGLDPGVLVGGVVVHHHLQLPTRIGLGDELEEGQELAVAMAGMAGVGHLTGRHLQRGNQRRGAVPEGVVGPPLNAARRHRPDRLGAFGRLDLGLLVPTEHDRARGGIQLQPDHVAHSGLQLRVGGELERLGLPGLDVMLGPDPRDRAVAEPELGGQQPRRPVGHP